jgi:ATP-dependent Clp protease ATP-binding subunit ClpA
MADRFDKFTDRARRVLTLAQEEAQRFNHNYIGTEHLLLGLIREDTGVAARVLGNLGVELNKVRSSVEFIIGRGDRAVLGEIGLTPRSKKVIELAVDEARRLNHHYIGTEHLLLGLVREGEGIASGVLESLGVNLDRVRVETTRVLSEATPTDAPPGHASSPRPVELPAGRAFGSGLSLGMRLSAQARAVIETAGAESTRLRAELITAEHLMLALLQVPEISDVLKSAGADMDALRKALEGGSGLDEPTGGP